MYSHSIATNDTTKLTRVLYKYATLDHLGYGVKKRKKRRGTWLVSLCNDTTDSFDSNPTPHLHVSFYKSSLVQFSSVLVSLLSVATTVSYSLTFDLQLSRGLALTPDSSLLLSSKRACVHLRRPGPSITRLSIKTASQQLTPTAILYTMYQSSCFLSSLAARER